MQSFGNGSSFHPDLHGKHLIWMHVYYFGAKKLFSYEGLNEMNHGQMKLFTSLK